MAHATQLDYLTADLVQVITGYGKTTDALGLKACIETASRSLRTHKFARTNQFSVRASLDGLVEKCHIFNNGALAQELEQRLETLEIHTYKWKPEILSLLLSLADRPAEKVNVADLVPEAVGEQVQQLTWDEIVKDDPLTEPGIWETVDFRRDESDYESVFDSVDITELTDGTIPSSPASDEYVRTAESLVLPFDNAAIKPLLDASAWHRDSKQSVKITEFQCLREAIHMLLCLPTSVFQHSMSGEMVIVKPKVYLEHISDMVLQHLLESFASVGSVLRALRHFANARQSSTLFQAFASFLANVLADFDREVTEIELRLVSGKEIRCTSLLDTYDQIALHLPLLQSVLDVLTQVQDLHLHNHFQLLDELFEKVVLAQISDQVSHFQVLAGMFCSCLQVYMKPMIKWMERGELDSDERLCPFAISSKNDIADFWQHRYAILEEDGQWTAPRFLWDFIPKMFAAGKEIALMKEWRLNFYQSPITKMHNPVSFANVCPTDSLDSLLPFSESMRRALHQLLRTNPPHIWSSLKQHTLFQQGLLATISGLDELYLSSNGTIFQSFAHEMFRKLDLKGRNSLSTYALEDLVQQTFGTSIMSGRTGLSVSRYNSPKQGENMRRTFDTISTAITYTYSESFKIILPAASISTYKRVFALLLTTERARYSLTSIALRFPIRSTNTQRLLHRIRHSLLWFTTTIQTYLFNVAISPSSLELHSAFLGASNMDAMIEAHTIFVTNLEKRCLLVNDTKTVMNAMLALSDLAVKVAALVHQITLEQQNTTPYVGGVKQHLKRQRFNDIDDSHSSDDETAYSGNTKDSKVTTPQVSESLRARLIQIQDQYSELLQHAIAGLRSAARGGGADPAWEMLVEMLDWG